MWTFACTPLGPTKLARKTGGRGSNLGARYPQVKFFCAAFFSKSTNISCHFFRLIAKSGLWLTILQILKKIPSQNCEKMGFNNFWGRGTFLVWPLGGPVPPPSDWCSLHLWGPWSKHFLNGGNRPPFWGDIGFQKLSLGPILAPFFSNPKFANGRSVGMLKVHMSGHKLWKFKKNRNSSIFLNCIQIWTPKNWQIFGFFGGLIPLEESYPNFLHKLYSPWEPQYNGFCLGESSPI